MSDESPLGNIREQLDETEPPEEPEVPEEPQAGEEPTDAEGDEDAEGPWFSFAEAKQRPLYPHEDRWEDLEDAKFEMELVLREHGVKDVEGRELDDAILQYAVDHPEAVAELVLAARGELEEDEDG